MLEHLFSGPLRTAFGVSAGRLSFCKVKLLVGAAAMAGLAAMSLNERSKAASENIPECIRHLKNASSLQTEIIGQFVRSKTFAEFRAALKLAIDPRGRELDWLMREGTPAGRLYACLIAWELDADAGLERFKSLSEDHARVYFRNGCIVETLAVADVAGEFLESKRFRDFPSKDRQG